MKAQNKLFVRIDIKNENKQSTTEDFEEHIRYVKQVASKRYFVGGGFVNSTGGMIIFEAEDMREAKEIAEKDPIILGGFYRFNIYEWNLVIRPI